MMGIVRKETLTATVENTTAIKATIFIELPVVDNRVLSVVDEPESNRE